MSLLEKYREVAGSDVIEHLLQLAGYLKGARVVHVNSTRSGGGVAEILNKMVPLMQDLGLDVSWEVIQGENDFYQCTKMFHNSIQGNKVQIPEGYLKVYEETNRLAAEEMRDKLSGADFVVIHDPQPAALIQHFQKNRAKWIWRCHIDANKPYRPVWKYLRNHVIHFDASIFSLSAFAQSLPHPVYLIAPSIDPLHEKNIHLEEKEVLETVRNFGVDTDRPLVVQVSRYDRFKDPIGVIHAYKLAKRFIHDLQLVLLGGAATDDPEGEVILQEVRTAAKDDPDIHVLLLPGDSHREVNAFQRAADVVMQKSVREGFGLTVTEAMWKKTPVIGGDTGGIRIQVVNHYTGFLVNTPEGAALRMRYLFQYPELMKQMGETARELVRENFLITRNLREYLTLMFALVREKEDRIIL